MRCLKRAIAREAYRALTREHTTTTEDEEQKHLREAKNISQSQAARALNSTPPAPPTSSTNAAPYPNSPTATKNASKPLDTQ